MPRGMDTLDMITTQTLLMANTTFPARIESWNGREATIQPLLMRKEYNEDAEVPPIVEGVTCIQHRYEIHDSKAIDVFIPGGLENHYSITFNEPVYFMPVFKKGDIVLCSVSQRSLDDIDTKQPYLPQKSRVMNLQDSVIVGVLIRA